MMLSAMRSFIHPARPDRPHHSGLGEPSGLPASRSQHAAVCDDRAQDAPIDPASYSIAVSYSIG